MMHVWNTLADNVRFAIVGLGMGRGRADMCQATPGAELVAICDLSEERGPTAASELGVPWMQSYDELLARDDVDVIGLWTPSGSHAAMAVRALEAGKHVCMTKPFDITKAACDAAIDAATARGLLLAVDFEQRYLADNHRISRAISEGAIGRVMSADLRMRWFRQQSYYDTGLPQRWRARSNTEGGSLANQAVHYLDLLLWWVGDAERVLGRRGTYGHDIETEDRTTALLEFRDGAVGSLLTSTCSFPGFGQQVSIGGSWGTLEWSGDTPAATISRVPEAARTGSDVFRASVSPTAVVTDASAYPAPENLPANVFADMVQAIGGGGAVQCDGREARRTVALFEAAYASSACGSWVEV
jgi:UDP-N-acetyl-2-amino-2-deoxyglucuronate dehydrogenase